MFEKSLELFTVFLVLKLKMYFFFKKIYQADVIKKQL